MNAIALWTARLKTSVPAKQWLDVISDLMTVLCAFAQKDRKFILQRRMYLVWFSSSSSLAFFTHFLFRCPSVSSTSPPLPHSCLLINDRSAAEKQSMSVQDDWPGLRVLSVSWPQACRYVRAKLLQPFKSDCFHGQHLLNFFWQNEDFELRRSLI